jgi:hypothetical protein
MLLPSLLLHYAAGMPSGSTFLEACISTAYSSMMALHVCQMPQWGLFLQPHQGEEHEGEPQFKAAELITELLPTLLGVSARVIQLLQASLQGGPTAAGDPDITPELCREACASIARLLVPLVELSHSHVPGSYLARDIFLPVLPQHLCEVLSALECFVRSAAATELSAGGAPTNSLSDSTRFAIIEVAGLFRSSTQHIYYFIMRSFTPDKQPLARLALSTAPGSLERKRLYSLLFSLHKLSNLWGRGTGSHSIAVVCTDAIVACCSSPFVTYSEPGPPADSTTAAAADGGRAATRAVSIHTTGPGTQPLAASAAEVLSLLPSLVLSGRCCLFEAWRMQQHTPEEVIDFFSGSCTDCVLGACEMWVNTPSASQHLSTLGYDPLALKKAATEALRAYDAAQADTNLLGRPSQGSSGTEAASSGDGACFRCCEGCLQ